jgi:hypothetical protein
MFHVPELARDTTHPMLGTTAADGNNGAFDLESPEPGWRLALICSDGSEAPEQMEWQWEHVSVHAYRARSSDVVGLLGRAESVPKTRTPTWKEMSYVKRLCWDGEDVVVQFHPRESEYVNCHPHVLHLWRPKLQPIPTPPSILVGPQDANVSVR